jgi:hypothetical protein
MHFLRALRNSAVYLLALFGVLLFMNPSLLLAQTGTSGTVSGVVTDPTNTAVASAMVSINDPVSGYMRTMTTGSAGDFTFANVPFNSYHLAVVAPGFANHAQDVDVRSAVPVKLEIALKLGATSATVTVTENAADILEVEPTSHTDVDRELFDRLPLESPSSSVSSLITLASPGIVADSNGLFHGLGDHAENSFSVDGQPITEWAHSKIPGFTIHGTVPNFHGFSAFIVLAHVSARFFNPQESGVGATPGGPAGAVFRIDHDETLEQTTHVQYQPWQRGPWFGFNWRYDSGLVVSGILDVAAALQLTGNEQATIGFSCNGVLATPQNPITTCNGIGASKLITLPQTGTEDDDHNPCV